MKKALLILSISSLVLFASCKKDSNPKPSSPLPVDTLGVGWEKINFIDTSFISVIFFFNNTGFAGGSNRYSSTIYKSSDGGENWSQLTAASVLNPYPFYNMGMGNEMNASFVMRYNQLVTTHNGGATFTIKDMPDSFLTDVCSVSPTVEYAIGNSLWKSIDDGDNWIDVYDFGPLGGWSSLFFTNEQTGWIMKRTGVYKTINGGVDWQKANTDTINLNQEGPIFSLNSDTCYFTNNYSLYKTVNGGASWNKDFNFTYYYYHNFNFVSESVGYVADGRCIFKTADGGKTWVKVVALASNIINDLYFTDANHGWACGQGGTILKFSQ